MNIKKREITINTDFNLDTDNEDYKANVITPQKFRRRLNIVDTIGD